MPTKILELAENYENSFKQLLIESNPEIFGNQLEQIESVPPEQEIVDLVKATKETHVKKQTKPTNKQPSSNSNNIIKNCNSFFAKYNNIDNNKNVTLFRIPRDVLFYILQFLDKKDLAKLALASQIFAQHIDNNKLLNTLPLASLNYTQKPSLKKLQIEGLTSNKKTCLSKLTPQNHLMITSGLQVYLYDPIKEKVINTYDINEVQQKKWFSASAITTFDFLSNNEVVFGTSDGFIVAKNINGGKPIFKIQLRNKSIHQILVLPDQKIVYTHERGDHFYLYDIAQQKQLKCERIASIWEFTINDLDIHLLPKLNTIIFNYLCHCVSYWNTQNWSVIGETKVEYTDEYLNPEAIIVMKVIADDQIIHIRSNQIQITTYDQHMNRIKVEEYHFPCATKSYIVTAVCILNDHQIALGQSNGSITIFDKSTKTSQTFKHAELNSSIQDLFLLPTNQLISVSAQGLCIHRFPLLKQEQMQEQKQAEASVLPKNSL